jgi:hypothetical protein
MRGQRVGGLVRYLYATEGGRLANDHVNPRLVAAWDADHDRLAPGDLAGLLEAPVWAQLAPVDRPVWHVAIRAAADDQVLTDAQWAELARDVMHRTGLARHDDDGGVRWIAVRHADDHIHLVATLARQDGRKASIWQDRYRLGEACRAAEDRWGLTVTAERGTRTSPPAPAQAETRKADRHAEKARRDGRAPLTRDRVDGTARSSQSESVREVLRREARVAALASSNPEDFAARLARAGVVVRWRESEREPGTVTGYAVGLARDTTGRDRDTGAAAPVMFGGGKLAPDLSLPQLRRAWADRASGEAGAGSPARAVTAAARAAERDVRAAVDAGAWGRVEGVAAAAGEALTAVGRASEQHGRSGPATTAADLYAGAGVEPRGRAPERSPVADGLSTAARGLAAAGRVAQAEDLSGAVVALAALTAQVARARAAQGRTAQARSAARAAEAARQAAAVTRRTTSSARAGGPVAVVTRPRVPGLEAGRGLGR